MEKFSHDDCIIATPSRFRRTLSHFHDFQGKAKVIRKFLGIFNISTSMLVGAVVELSILLQSDLFIFQATGTRKENIQFNFRYEFSKLLLRIIFIFSPANTAALQGMKTTSENWVTNLKKWILDQNAPVRADFK